MKIAFHLRGIHDHSGEKALAAIRVNKKIEKACVFIVGCIFLLAIAATIYGKEPNLKSVSIQYVQSLLQKAKKAVEEGKPEKARLIWLQIRSLNPSLSKPSWLEANVASVTFCASVSGKSGAAMVDETSEKKQFEAELKANPFNKEARQALYRIAKRDGDQAAMLRHHSILQAKNRTYYSEYLKWIVVFIIFSLIICLILSPLPDAKDSTSSTRNNLFFEILKSILGFFKKRQ